MNNLRSNIIGMSLVCAAAAVVILGGTSAATAKEDSATRTVHVDEVVRADANYDLQVITAPPTAADHLPANVPPATLGNGGLRAESVRIVSANATANTYVALNTKNQLCLVVYIPGPDWTSGSTCTTPELFAQGGLGLRIGNTSDAYETYLVPDSVAAKSSLVAKVKGLTVGGPAVKTSSTNLIVVDPELSSASRRNLSTISNEIPLSLLKWSFSDEK